MKKKKKDTRDKKGNSKYARKKAYHRSLCKKLGLKSNTPYPTIQLNLGM